MFADSRKRRASPNRRRSSNQCRASAPFAADLGRVRAVRHRPAVHVQFRAALHAYRVHQISIVDEASSKAIDGLEDYADANRLRAQVPAYR
jgi:hypothetical protein